MRRRGRVCSSGKSRDADSRNAHASKITKRGAAALRGSADKSGPAPRNRNGECHGCMETIGAVLRKQKGWNFKHEQEQYCPIDNPQFRAYHMSPAPLRIGLMLPKPPAIPASIKLGTLN